MTTVVISQPMLFPWAGMFEQIRLADVFVHYDDVAFSKGSFTNRVQIKTEQGSAWLTAPLKKFELGRPINGIEINQESDWRRDHARLLEAAYRKAPHYAEMRDLVDEVYAGDVHDIGALGIASIEAVCRYFDLTPCQGFSRSSQLAIPGKGSQRVLDVVKRFSGDVYVTGHGARNYLDHEVFACSGVDVRYLDYQLRPYPQLHGRFTPYVTILDLIANTGRAGREFLTSPAVHWRDFLKNAA